MAESTWINITTGMHAAIHKSYANKSKRQKNKREVRKVWNNLEDIGFDLQCKLLNNTYQVGKYRHFWLQDKKKKRNVSVLPFVDRCVQNDVKDAIQPVIMYYMTDDMFGGLPGRGVVANNSRYSVVSQMRIALNNKNYKYYLQGDISKFYDHVDKVITMRLLEKKIKDRRTLAVIRQHLFNQKKLAIGDPFSHLIANMNMSVIIRKAKGKYGKQIKIINFADDFIAFGKEKETLMNLRRDMQKWAKGMRLHYKPMYVRPIDTKDAIIFCGFCYKRGIVRLMQSTKKRYIKTRHKRRSVASYNGLLKVADTKNLRYIIESQDNKMMDCKNKIRRPFAGRPMKIETLEGIKHTIVNMAVKSSRQRDTDTYMHVQAIADGLGLIVYSTGSSKICEYLKTKMQNDLPLRDMTIVHDWSGYYYEGTVYTDAEEEEMIRTQYNIPK